MKFRLGEFEAAKSYLQESLELSLKSTESSESPFDLSKASGSFISNAFLAMTHFQLNEFGRVQNAASSDGPDRTRYQSRQLATKTHSKTSA